MNWTSVRAKYPPDGQIVLAYSQGQGYYLAVLDSGLWEDANTMATLPDDITHWAELFPPSDEPTKD